jgi:transcriptional regulator with XRE-family HTH domain
MTPREILAQTLRQARIDAGYDSQGKFARELHKSRPVVTRAENADQPVPSADVIESWADVTGVDLEKLTDLAERCRSGTPDWFMPYLAAESGATLLRSWAVVIVPGLLQTAPYSRAVLSGEPTTPERLTELVEARTARQRVLQRAHLVAVIEASVLSRLMGDATIMADQCAHLATMAERPNIALHIVPAGTNHGAWAGLDIASRDGLVTVDFTTATDDIPTTAAKAVDRAMTTFERVLGHALPPDASLDFVRQQEEQWKQQI